MSLAAPSLPIDSTKSSLLDLDETVLLKLFERSTLNQQIKFARLCQYFKDLIEDIWRRQTKIVKYDAHALQFEHQLDENDVALYCSSIGRRVQDLIFKGGSVSFVPLMKKHFPGNQRKPLSRARQYLNLHFCRNLNFFANLQTFEAHSTCLADYTVRELARYCNQLRVFRLVDSSLQWVRPDSFSLFQTLEEFSVVHLPRQYPCNNCDCCGLKLPDGRMYLACCQCRRISTFIERVCRHLTKLKIFKFSINDDVDLELSIFLLKRLELLQISWYSYCDSSLASKVFAMVLQVKDKNITGLKFANSHVGLYIEKNSHKNCKDYEYALKREEVAALCYPVLWFPEIFNDLRMIFGRLINLQHITFEYVRILTHEQLVVLPKICKKLKTIKIIGCPKQEDEDLRSKWSNMQQEKGQLQQCQMIIEAYVPLEVVKEIRRRRHPGTQNSDVLCYYEIEFENF